MDGPLDPMIRFVQGNLLDAQVEALVNAVNTVGVMGKGIALMFREAFPENFRAYEIACKRREVGVGRMFVTETSNHVRCRWIINFPTKKHWRNPSRLEWIIDGLQDLRRVIRVCNLRSIALPALGTGNGGLDWSQDRAEVQRALGDLENVDVLVYESRQYSNRSLNRWNWNYPEEDVRSQVLFFPQSIHRYLVFTPTIALTSVKQLFSLVRVDG